MPFMIWVDKEDAQSWLRREVMIKGRCEERQKKMLEQFSLPALLRVWYDDEEDYGGGSGGRP